MNAILKYSLVGLGIFILGAAVGHFASPSKVIEKEHIVYKDRVVEKKVYVENTKKQDHKVYVRITTVKPDGTKTTETRIYDNDTIDITQNSSDKTIDNKTVDKTSEKVVEYNKDQYLFAFQVKSNINPLLPSYGLSAQKRVIGPLYLGVFGFTDLTFGASLGLSL